MLQASATHYNLASNLALHDVILWRKKSKQNIIYIIRSNRLVGESTPAEAGSDKFH